MKTLITAGILAVASLMVAPAAFAQHKYATNTAFVSFFAEAPISDVDAQNNNVKVELIPSNGELTFDMAMRDFVFKSGKMGRDAQKKYLETQLFPAASFKGKIEGKVDYDKPGTYPVTASGKLKVHGVERNVTEKGTIVVEAGGVKLESQFNVTLADYKIETPQILGKKMTSEHVLVKIGAKLGKATTDVASERKPK